MIQTHPDNLTAATAALLNPTWDRPADTLRDELEVQFDRVRNNAMLSPEARQAFMAELYVAARRTMDVLQEGSGAATARSLADAKRRLYGIDDILASASPSEKITAAISFRDAQDRAGQLENESQARTLLDTADRSGDELLARAVGSWAIDNGDQDLTEQYLAGRPAQAQALADLQQMSRPLNAATMFEFALPRPPELSAYSDTAIDSLATRAAEYRSAG